MGELSLATPTKDSLALDADSWANKAKALVINSAEACVNASYLLRSVKGVRADIAKWFEPHIEAAMETKRKADAARKALVEEKERMETPLVLAEGLLKRNLLAYEQEQEQRRAEEERRLQEEARQQAEAATLAAAAALESEAVKTGDAGMLAEAHDILEQPIEAPVVSVKTSMPKVQGIVYRDNWKAHPEINVKALAMAVAQGRVPETFLNTNLTAINQFARATQGANTVPGVRFFNDRQIAARG